MGDFDVFTNEIEFTKPVYRNILNKYVKDIPNIPSGPNYESGRKLMGVEYLAEGEETQCAYHFSESAAPTIRTLAMYRDEQLLIEENKLSKITTYIKPIQDIIDSNSISKEEEELFDLLPDDSETRDILKEYEFKDDSPFYKQYMKFGGENNVDNFLKILKELPKEWTVIQLTAPYNPNENFKPLNEYRTEIDAIYLTLLTNDYLDQDVGPLTVEIPANVTKGEVKPLFQELYSILDENYKTIDNAQFLNNKRLVQNYWSRREDIDLRMKSVINVMYKEWLGGWSSLLTGKLIDTKMRERLITLVDTAIADWGFFKLTKKQKILLYNLLENSSVLSSQQIKSCIRKILTEQGNTEDVRQFLKTSDCGICNTEFKFLNELCLKCLSRCFEKTHNFTLVDGIKAFSQVALRIREDCEWEDLKKAKRNPVILIVDEMLDTFPWETLPILNQHPVTRMENIHFLYMLYKIHEDRIVDGYFRAKADVGTYIINPEKNLERMELRMSSFVRYWCPAWAGHAGRAPSPPRYVRALAAADVLLYCGHGDGAQLAGAAAVQRTRARAVAVLAGCGSVRLRRPAARAPAAAAHVHLHVAACPAVLGMLWEVTDLEVDKAVSALLALSVPSPAPLAWRSVGKAQWSRGVLDLNVEEKEPVAPERDLLRAMCRARGATNFIMIASSLVARGLPVMMPDK